MEQLIKRAWAGDKDAFVALMERHKLSLLGVARAILKNEEDVADVMQETVLSAYEKLYTLKKPKYFKSWLTRILINHCYGVLRQRKTVSLEDYLPEAGDTEEARWDARLDVQAALMGSGAGERLVLILYYVEDMSQREIAKLLGISENAVKQRLARGRKNFRNVYLREAAVNE